VHGLIGLLSRPVVAFLTLSIGHDSIWFTRSYIGCVSSLINLERGQQHSSRRNIARHMSISTYAGLGDLGEAELRGGIFQDRFRRCPLAWLRLWAVRGRTVDVDDHENSSVSIMGIPRAWGARRAA